MQKDKAADLIHSENSIAPLSDTLVIFLACAAGMSVANVYFAQPILDFIAQGFALQPAYTGLIITITQLGTIFALLFIVPLGDLVLRKPLLLIQATCLILALLLLGSAGQIWLLLLSFFLVGMLGTAMTQSLIVYTSVLSKAEERGAAVAIVQAGVLFGILLSRVFAGVFSDLFGWQGVYFSSALIIFLISFFLWINLPSTGKVRREISYKNIIYSLLEQLCTNRILQIRGVLAFWGFMNLNLFWNALVFPLSVSPFQYSHSTIGAFGLIGAVGAMVAIRVGKWVDQGYLDKITVCALMLLILSWLLLLWLKTSMILFIFGIVILDIAIQAIHVSNQSAILKQAKIELHARLVGAYMLFYALGSATGGAIATSVYAHWGWIGICGAGIFSSVLALIFFISNPKIKIKT